MLSSPISWQLKKRWRGHLFKSEEHKIEYFLDLQAAYNVNCKKKGAILAVNFFLYAVVLSDCVHSS